MEFCARFTTLSAAVTASRCAGRPLPTPTHSPHPHHTHHTHLSPSDPRRPGDTVFIQPGAHVANNVVIKWPLHMIGGGQTPIDNTQLQCLGSVQTGIRPCRVLRPPLFFFTQEGLRKLSTHVVCTSLTSRIHTPSAPPTGGSMRAWMLTAAATCASPRSHPAGAPATRR